MPNVGAVPVTVTTGSDAPAPTAAALVHVRVPNELEHDQPLPDAACPIRPELISNVTGAGDSPTPGLLTVAVRVAGPPLGYEAGPASATARSKFGGATGVDTIRESSNGFASWGPCRLADAVRDPVWPENTVPVQFSTGSAVPAGTEFGLVHENVPMPTVHDQSVPATAPTVPLPVIVTGPGASV